MVRDLRLFYDFLILLQWSNIDNYTSNPLDKIIKTYNAHYNVKEEHFQMKLKYSLRLVTLANDNEFILAW